MMSRISLINLTDLPPGQSAEVVAEGKIFAVFNVDGTVHVLDGICPHAGGPLGKGSLRGDVVTCPWHGWQFQVSSGQHCLNARICQTRYEAVVEDGRVMIEV
ncbi:MAG: Rieske (2Fe-2S) protein [Planctomycetaceae bacterium]|nr:Rieske (2Fe-2S) protein [Planctomycetaceae bacterium]